MNAHEWQVSDLDDPDVFTGVLPVRCKWCQVAKHRSTNDECAYPNGEGMFQRGEET